MKPATNTKTAEIRYPDIVVTNEESLKLAGRRLCLQADTEIAISCVVSLPMADVRFRTEVAECTLHYGNSI